MKANICSVSKSVWEQRHRQTLAALKEDGSGDGRRPEPPAHLVECRVELVTSPAIERERKLDGAPVAEVADGNSDERDAAALDHRRGDREQLPCRGEDRVRIRARFGQRVRASRAR